MPWLVRGDIDGFFGLAIDNLVQLLLIDTLCRFVLGFPPDLVYGRVLPGAAVSILVGNLFYAVQGSIRLPHTGHAVGSSTAANSCPSGQYHTGIRWPHHSCREMFQSRSPASQSR